MSGDFLDSNVLVYLVDETEEPKHRIARDLVARGLERRDAVISHQVIHETLNAITRKIATPVAPRDAGDFMHRVLVPL